MTGKVGGNQQEIIVAGQVMTADADRVLYWHESQTLFVSDPHFGKVNHFRKSGIPIPREMLEGNFNRLFRMLDAYKPSQVIFLGDLFHSDKNEEWNILKEFLEEYETIDFVLVLGNHDIIGRYELEESPLTCYEQLDLDPFVLTHYPIEKFEGPGFNLCGHVHPGVTLRGGPGQALRLPCFYFSSHQGILPAFGDFTGSFRIKPKRNDRVIAIAKNELLYFDANMTSMKSGSH